MQRLDDNHYASRCLTRPWEFHDRRLWYYDFDRRTVRRGFSKSLLQRPGPRETNCRLDRLIETPLSNYRKALIAQAMRPVVAIQDASVFQALTLLIMLQPLRSKEAYDQSVSNVLAWNEEKLGELVRAICARYRLVRLRADPAVPLFYPSSGFFVIPAECSDRVFDVVHAIPLTECYAAAAVPVTVDVRSLRSQWGSRSATVISNCSVGTSSRRVVIHPSLVDSVPRKALSAGIEDARRDALRLVNSCGDVNKVLVEFSRIAGCP